MRPILKLSLRSILEKPLRTLLTLISVILSVSLVVTVCCFASAFLTIIGVDFDSFEFEDTASIAFFSVLILIAAIFSAVMIYSALSMRFDGKTRIVGTLSALGAGVGQRIVYLFSETIFYTFVGLPSGILLGLVLGKQSMRAFADGMGFTLSGLTLRPSWMVWMILLSIASMAVASFIPILRMVRMSVFDCMKSGQKIHVDLRAGIFTRFMTKFFGRMGLLAGQNCKNHRTRLRGVAWSLSAAGIFSSMLFSLWRYITQNTRYSTLFHIIHDEEDLRIFNQSSTALLIAIVGATTICAVSVTIVNQRSRRSEFATLSAIGLTRSDLCKMMVLEMVYISFYTLFFTFVGSLICNIAIYIMGTLSGVTPVFDFPWAQTGIFLLFSLILCLLLTLYSVLGVRRFSLAQEMRDGE